LGKFTLVQILKTAHCNIFWELDLAFNSRVHNAKVLIKLAQLGKTMANKSSFMAANKFTAKANFIKEVKGKNLYFENLE